MTSIVLQQFVDRVEAFLSRTGMTPTAFGDLACNDRSFVADLRGGEREPRLSTIEKVDRFMNEYDAAPSSGDQAALAARIRVA